MISRRVPVWLCAVVVLVALTGASLMQTGPVLAASGTVSTETPLHDSPDPAAPVIALLSEGTVLSIDGPPVEGFYPVTTGDLSGWMRGESLQLEKDSVASDAPEELAVEAPLDATVETVPVQATTDLDPATDLAMATTVEPAANASATTEEPPPAAEPATGDGSVPTTEPVPADGMPPDSEPVPMDAVVLAPDSLTTADVTPVPTTPDAAIPPPDDAALGLDGVMVDAPILAGPGSDYGFIATAPAGSTVEKTGHVIDGYVTVQYAEVTGWVALAHLSAPSAHVEAPPPAETAVPTEMPPAETPPPVLDPTPANEAPADVALVGAL